MSKYLELTKSMKRKGEVIKKRDAQIKTLESELTSARDTIRSHDLHIQAQKSNWESACTSLDGMSAQMQNGK